MPYNKKKKGGGGGGEVLHVQVYFKETSFVIGRKIFQVSTRPCTLSWRKRFHGSINPTGETDWKVTRLTRRG